jgi:hypothetical protein
MTGEPPAPPGEPPAPPPPGEPPLPFPDSLCHRCQHHRYVVGRSSIFIRCQALPLKYPPQPVRACPAFKPG